MEGACLSPHRMVGRSTRVPFLRPSKLICSENRFPELSDYPDQRSVVARYVKQSGLTLVSFRRPAKSLQKRIIHLPSSVPLISPLDEVIRFRRSIRCFSGEPTNLQYVATLLRSGYGLSEMDAYRTAFTTSSRDALNLAVRTVPSVNAFYPIEIYLLAQNINHVNAGLYRYDVKSDCLVHEMAEQDVDALLHSYMAADKGAIRVKQSCGVLLFVARPWRCINKYGEHGLRYVFHEAGSIAQNLHLVMTGLGLGSVDCLQYQQPNVENHMAVDGQSALLVHSIVFGVPEVDRQLN